MKYFEKWQGIGNDFVVLDVEVEEYSKAELSKVAKRLCDRRFGIGGDGLICMGSSSQADFRMTIINSDGSPANMCGNALRCAVAQAFKSGRVTKTTMTVETDAGIKIGKVNSKSNNQPLAITINMGKPEWEPAKIPTLSKEVVEIPVYLPSCEKTYTVTALNTGVPHIVSFVEDFNFDWHHVGQELMTNPLFPEQTNVNFIQVVAADHLNMRVWERGAGPTLACGTGACASAVAAARTGRADRKVTVSLPGGDLEIEWDQEDYIWMTGAAERSFVGEIEIDDLKI